MFRWVKRLMRLSLRLSPAAVIIQSWDVLVCTLMILVLGNLAPWGGMWDFIACLLLFGVRLRRIYEEAWGND